MLFEELKRAQLWNLKLFWALYTEYLLTEANRKKKKLLSSSNTQEVMINMKEQGW